MQGSTGPAVYLEADQGDQGDLGPPGPVGPQGATGLQGSQGAAGPAVYLEADYQEADMFLVQGNQGQTGSTGLTGSQGPIGPAVYLEAESQEPDMFLVQGNQGAQGQTGATGVQGLPGPAVYLEAPEADEPMMAMNLPAPITVGYIPFGAGASTFGSSANLFWDNTNVRLGVGTSSPLVKLHVSTSGNTPIINETTGGVTSYFNLRNTAGQAYIASSTNDLIFALTASATEGMRLTSAGGVSFGVTGTAYGTSGQILTSAGNAPPTWTTPVVNTVSAPITKTADFTVANGETWFINNKPTTTCTVTLPAASSWTGRQLTFKNLQTQTLVSASSNVVPIDSATAGTAILLGVVGNWATMVSDGTNWIIMQAASNNNLLLE